VTTLVLALRGAAAIAILTTLAGGLPRVVQLGLAVTLGLWAAVVAGAASPPLHDDLLLVAVRELVLGATLGVIASLPLLAAQTAGRLVDLAGATRGPYAALFGLLGAAVFVGIDGHVAVVAAIADSFTDVPAIGDLRPRLVVTLSNLITAAVRLAIPWLITAAVVQLAAGIASRLASRAAAHLPSGSAVPAALVMITATLVSTLAVALAALVMGTG